MDGVEKFATTVEAVRGDGAGDAELGLIACAIADGDRAVRVIDRAAVDVMPSTFGTAPNGRVWAALLAVHARGEVPDVVLIADELRDDKQAERALLAAAEVIAAPSAFVPYVDRIVAHATRRQVKAKLREAYRAVEDAPSPEKGVEAASEMLRDLPRDTKTRHDDSIKAAVAATLQRLLKRREEMLAGRRATARWGVFALDGGYDEGGGFFEGAVGGLFPGKLYVIAGTPGAGKTSLAWQATLATARGDEQTPGKRVIVFSLEMSREDICQRLAAQACGISEAHIENGAIDEQQTDALTAFLLELAALPIAIVGRCRTVEEMRARVLAEIATHGADGVGLVVIDFLQRAKTGRRGDDGHRDEQDRVYEAKGIANEGVPVLAVSSMSKGSQTKATEKGKGKLSSADTAGSGTEFAADFMAFLVLSDPDDRGGRVEVRFETVKRRNGPISPTTLLFDRTRGQFETVKRVVEYDLPEGMEDRDDDR